MRKRIIYRMSFRLTAKEADLLWLDADKQTPALSVLVKQVLKGVLNNEHVTIRVPSKPKIPPRTKTVGVRFYEGEDDEIAEWIKKIDYGSRGIVIKELLRHSMEVFDFRPYTAKKMSIEIPQKTYPQSIAVLNKTVKSGLKNMPTTEIEEIKKEWHEEPEDNFEEEDFFAAFSKLAKQ